MNSKEPATTHSETDSEYVLELSKIAQEDLPEVGAKAANLGLLLHSGFPVPEGFVLTTGAFRRFITENQLNRESKNLDKRSFSIPSDVDKALATILAKLRNRMLAVRSSGVNEDSSDSSYAGQYETVLGVKNQAELKEAVKQCWLSVFSKRAEAYERERSGEGTSDMAVLIQTLVRSDASGVAFTTNPVTGAKEVLVSAVRGLGDRLVSGTATPDEWVVGEKTVCTSKVENAVSEDQVNRIAQLAKRVEKHFGRAQDIEWAIAGGEVFLLQARPITTTNQAPSLRKTVEQVPIPIVVPDGYWTIEKEHFPVPMSPMYVSYGPPIIRETVLLGAKDLGLPFEGLDFKLIGGWTYRRIIPPGGKDRRPPPVWLMRILIHIMPSIRSQIKKMTQTVRTNLMNQYVERWEDEWKQQTMQKSRELLQTNLTALSDKQLDAHLSAVLEHFRNGAEIHFRYLAFPLLTVGELALTCQDLLGWDNKRVFDLLAGLCESDSETSRRLSELVRLVKNDERLAKAIARINQATKTEDITSINQAFREKFDLYLRDFGATSLGYEPMCPTIAEVPLDLLRLIQSQITTNFDSSTKTRALQKIRETTEAQASEQLKSMATEAKTRFEDVLRRARAAYAIHDEETLYTQHLAYGITRYALLEVGARLAAKKIVNEPEDIFMLTLDEAKTAFKNGGDLKDLVRKRWGERVWAEANMGLPSYGKSPPPPPSLNIFPPEAQLLMRSLLWSIEAISMNKAGINGGSLTGIPASPGTYTGSARIVKDESEFSKLCPGDVLVCRSTNPSWSVVFSTIGALVTEAGGILSHPAIVAREYGIPAVLSLDGATSRIKDGMLIEVNGKDGTVAIRNSNPH